MLVQPINEAEAILDPFWDSSQSELNQWSIEEGAAHGLEVRQNWCWVQFGWARRPAGGPALRMHRSCGVDCRDYDRLVLSVMAPERAVVRLVADTDRGRRECEAPEAGIKKRELILELGGAARLDGVTIEVNAGSEGIAQGWFNWMGLQHSGRLAHKLAARTISEVCWEKHLKAESFDPQFVPAYGLMLDADALEGLRRRHAGAASIDDVSPFKAAADAARRVQPESLIHDFVNFWGDSRYNRERDHDRYILSHGLNAAIAGHVLRDKSLLRLAARYALSIGLCGRWDDGFICAMPGGVWEHRCFVQSLCAYEVAGILDLAGECFTALGRDFLLRRLAEEAIGAITFNTWKHGYIFRCNQLAWFTPGRMLALGVLSRHWPRVKPYLDIAYRELCESLENTILPDGGYVEGPTYFRCVGRDAGLGFYYYGRAANRPMAEVVPPVMRRCGAFAETLISTDDAGDMIPICDAMSRHELISQALMAGLLPGSAWGRMLAKTMARGGVWPIEPAVAGTWAVPQMADVAIAWSLAGEDLPSSSPPSFLVMPDMGPLVSQRRFGNHWVKLFIQGNRGGAGHTHEDKGSFVLEFAGDTLAMDPGTCDYSHPLAGILQHCERHNMLVPYGMPERPAPTCPLPADVKPCGTGDAVGCHAELDASPGWERYYRHWRRTWDSPAPDVLMITDDYELETGEGVEFLWQTRLPVERSGRTAHITGRKGRATLEAPEGCEWRMEEWPLLDGRQWCLSLRRAGRTGRLMVRIRLETIG